MIFVFAFKETMDIMGLCKFLRFRREINYKEY